MECYTYLRNGTDPLSDGKMPCERRFGQPLKGLIVPFCSLVECHPHNCEGSVESINLERKFCLDCSSDTLCTRGELGRVTYWLQTLELETMDASEIYSKRLNAKEVIFPQEGEFTFPIADGRIKNTWELRTSTLIQPRPIQGEGHVDFLGE